MRKYGQPLPFSRAPGIYVSLDHIIITKKDCLYTVNLFQVALESIIWPEMDWSFGLVKNGYEQLPVRLNGRIVIVNWTYFTVDARTLSYLNVLFQ